MKLWHWSTRVREHPPRQSPLESKNAVKRTLAARRLTPQDITAYGTSSQAGQTVHIIDHARTRVH
jgi:hypothetical protein